MIEQCQIYRKQSCAVVFYIIQLKVDFLTSFQRKNSRIFHWNKKCVVQNCTLNIIYHQWWCEKLKQMKWTSIYEVPKLPFLQIKCFRFFKYWKRRDNANLSLAKCPPKHTLKSGTIIEKGQKVTESLCVL